MATNNNITLCLQPGSRLSQKQLADNFTDIHPPLTAATVGIEADRCYYCYDAPCITACPTSIDIPLFIRQIYSKDLVGSAKTILKSNIMGGMCGRVCPTENLCEGACVRNDHEDKPVAIGLLQRYATDTVQATGKQLFKRQANTGKKVAIVGSGPAGMACAHQLSMLGNSVTVFEAKDKAGGLNEYGIAAYKTVDDFAQREIEYIMALGGIELKTEMALGREITLSGLKKDFDAIFIAVGLASVRPLNLENELADGVQNAVDYISVLRQSDDLGLLPVGEKVVVIGGGMTAIDIAVQSKCLGAKEVSIIYRRGPDDMGASELERQLAETNGINIHFWSKITQIITTNNAVTEVELEYTKLEASELKGTGEMYRIQTDSLFKAVGQLLKNDIAGINELQCENGKIMVDVNRRSSIKGVWAGGDCIDNGYDLVVASVEDGKIAALDIHQFINSQKKRRTLWQI